MNTSAQSSAFVIPPTSPNFWGSIGGLIIAVSLLGAGLYLTSGGGTPMPLNIALMVLGIVEGATSYYTLKGKRVAWAFSLSVNGTCSVVLLFSAPRLRDAAEVSILLALVPCLLFGVLVLLQSLNPEEF